MSFTIFKSETTRFQAIKSRSSKSCKIDIFPKGLTHGFGPKIASFLPFFFRQYTPGKCLLRYSRAKKRSFQAYINQKLKKSTKLRFFHRGEPMVLVQKWPFFQLFFLGNIGRKMSFTIFQSEKTPFQAIKTGSSRCRKIDIFPKGLTHGFGPKMASFPTFFFRQYKPGKCLLRHSRAKKGLSRL